MYITYFHDIILIYFMLRYEKNNNEEYICSFVCLFNFYFFIFIKWNISNYIYIYIDKVNQCCWWFGYNDNSAMNSSFHFHVLTVDSHPRYRRYTLVYIAIRNPIIVCSHSWMSVQTYTHTHTHIGAIATWTAYWNFCEFIVDIYTYISWKHITFINLTI